MGFLFKNIWVSSSVSTILLHFILGEEYIKSLIANPELVDRLALSSDDQVDIFSVMTFYYCWDFQEVIHLKWNLYRNLLFVL